MPFDVDELKFCGTVERVAEEEFYASTTDDADMNFAKHLYHQYCGSGKPQECEEWIRQELKKYFLYVTRPPEWIEQSTVPTWPYYDGRPMLFIDQVTVPENDVSSSSASPGAVLYIFGSKKPVPGVEGGWEMAYRVIEQLPGL